jgi:hypothetical protein
MPDDGSVDLRERLVDLLLGVLLILLLLEPILIGPQEDVPLEFCLIFFADLRTIGTAVGASHGCLLLRLACIQYSAAIAGTPRARGDRG